MSSPRIDSNRDELNYSQLFSFISKGDVAKVLKFIQENSMEALLEIVNEKGITTEFFHVKIIILY